MTSLPTFDEALAIVLAEANRVAAPAQEPVPLLASLGRVLAADLRADRDQPPFDRATRDGFAVRCEDGIEARRIVGTLAAGDSWTGPPLASHEAVEIMTGAPLPAGADAVVMVEHVQVADGALRIAAGHTPSRGANVVARGSEASAGACILRAGVKIGAAEIAVAASANYATLPVYARPRVAIIATGNELVELDAPMATAQIRNSNSYALAALVTAEGAEPVRHAAAQDTRASLRERIAEAIEQADLLLLSGGVSMGKHDLVEQVLAEEFGAKFHFTGARIQPGKPVVFGTLLQPKTRKALPFYGLPGNPISTQLTFAILVAPLLRALGGRSNIAPQFVEARLLEAVAAGTPMTRFLPAELTGTIDRTTVRVVSWQGSGDVAANARGNCYVVLPAEHGALPAGTTVRMLLR